MALPRRLSKEGESDAEDHQYTRYGTILLSVVQALGIAFFLEKNTEIAGGLPLVYNTGWSFRLLTVLTLTTGTAFIMWLGADHERGIATHVPIIFAGLS